MDVTCAHCGEPWNDYFLRHDLPHDCPSYKDKAVAKDWKAGANVDALRTELADEGWTFGKNVLDVRTCSCCKGKGESRADAAKLEMRDTLALLAGDDLDGLASDLEDFGL